MVTDTEFHIIHLTDLHGSEFLIPEIGEHLSTANLIIISGDLTHFGKKDQAESILKRIYEFNTKVLAIHGNCDFTEVEGFLKDQNINLHRQIVLFDRFALAGLGGSLPCPGNTPSVYSDQEAAKWLNELVIQNKTELPEIFVCHQPPLNTTNDRLEDNTHVGSWSVRQYIEKKQPLLCLTGHIHEAIGIDYIGNCPVINPGPFRTGKFADIFIASDNKVRIELNQITF